MKKFLFIIIAVIGLFSFSFAYDSVFELESYYNQSVSAEEVSFYVSEDYFSNLDTIHNNLLTSPEHLSKLSEYNYYFAIPYADGYARIYYSNYDLKFYFSSISRNAFLKYFYWTLYNDSSSSVDFIYDYYLIAEDYSVSYSSTNNFTLSANSFYSSSGENKPNFSVIRIYNNVVTNARALSFDDFLTLFKSNYDIYYYNTYERLIIADNGLPELPAIENPFNNSELLDIYERLDNTDILNDYLPNGYSNFFITYNDETGQYKVYFYHYSGLPYAKVYPENYSHSNNNIYDYLTYTLNIGSEEYYSFGLFDRFFGYSHAFPLYTFVTFGDSSDFWFHSTVEVEDLSKDIYSFDSRPIIFTSKDFPFFYLDEFGNLVKSDDGNVDTNYIVTIPHTVLTDEETGDDIIIGPTINDDKDTESLWTLISSIPQKIIDGIKAIFVPSSDFLSSKANEIIYKFSFYTSLLDTFQQFLDAITVDSNGSPVVAVDFSLSEDSVLADCGSANILDFSWYEPFKPVVDLFIIAFVYGVFLYRFIIELPNTIAGISQSFDYMPLSKDSPYSGSGKIGFKTPGGDKK